jgi:hypothetical protein
MLVRMSRLVGLLFLPETKELCALGDWVSPLFSDSPALRGIFLPRCGTGTNHA